MMDCQRKNMFGRPACRFEGRFDLGPAQFPPELKSFRTGPGEAAKFMSAFRQENYVRDVCVRCGRTIERNILSGQKEDAL